MFSLNWQVFWCISQRQWYCKKIIGVGLSCTSEHKNRICQQFLGQKCSPWKDYQCFAKLYFSTFLDEWIFDVEDTRLAHLLIQHCRSKWKHQLHTSVSTFIFDESKALFEASFNDRGDVLGPSMSQLESSLLSQFRPKTTAVNILTLWNVCEKFLRSASITNTSPENQNISKFVTKWLIINHWWSSLTRNFDPVT